MSRTTILSLWPGERYETLAELSNAWGAAAVAWDALGRRYLGLEPYRALFHMDRLWPLWKREDIPLHHRAVLMMTFDRAYVTRADYAKAASDIRAFLADFPMNEGVNHWPAIAALYEGNPEAPAIGIWHTSVSENPFAGPWDDEAECEQPTDWSECYDLYGELSVSVPPSPEERPTP